MPLSSFPLIAWGTPDDMSAAPWSTPVGTLAAITTTTDPFGGALAYTLNDTDGAAASRRQRSIAVTKDGVHALLVAAKAGTAAESQVLILEATGGAVRGAVTVTWSGPTFAAGNGGSFYGPVPLGAGWYGGILLCAGLVVANAPAIAYRPAGATAGATGSASFYVRNIVLLDLIDRAMSGDEPREGSEFEQAPSGFEEAYIVGWDEILEGQVRWIPPDPTSDPILSGWYGANESVGVNAGVKAMLRAGREKQLLRFVRDRATCSEGQDGYLAAPMKGIPDPERNGYRSFGLRLRGSTVFGGL